MCCRKCCWCKTRNNGTPSFSPKRKTNKGKNTQQRHSKFFAQMEDQQRQNILDGISILLPKVLPQVLLVENTQQRHSKFFIQIEDQQRQNGTLSFSPKWKTNKGKTYDQTLITASIFSLKILSY